MKKQAIIGFAVLLLLLLCACVPIEDGKSVESGVNTEETNSVAIASEAISGDTTNAIEEGLADDGTEQTVSQAYDQEFCVYKGENFIPIKAWENEIDVVKVAGEVIESNTIILGTTSDTFAGSYSKTVTYKGLNLEMFSPKDNGKTFWIETIEVTGYGFSTYRGIEIGKTLDDLFKFYPEIVNYDDENYFYYNPNDEYMHIEFKVKKGIVVSFQIKYVMP
jgi:hypothetical protein